MTILIYIDGRRIDVIYVMLDQMKGTEITISSSNITKNGVYTVLIIDPDAPNPDYIHLMRVNCHELSSCQEDDNYYPPQRIGHRY